MGKEPSQILFDWFEPRMLIWRGARLNEKAPWGHDPLREADPNSGGFFGGTALNWAAVNGHENMVNFLLAHGADPRLSDEPFEATPAGWAREGGHPQIERMLSNQL